ncbi:MAG: VWA domain-containing protein [Pseudomonadota bacterium]
MRDALTVGGGARAALVPIDGVALALAFAALGAAGPTWSRQVDPFAAQSAPLVIALKVTPSMAEIDIPPTRLERSKQKIRDLLELREGARTALVAYAGSAHVAVPMTDDPGVMLPYLAGLAHEVMPSEGNRAALALESAGALLEREEAQGAVLFVVDALDPADAEALNKSPNPVVVLAILPPGQSDVGLNALTGATVLAVTPDLTDVTRIDRMLDAAQARAALEDADQPWQDRGAWLAWPSALIMLLSFRRGWTMRWAALAALALALPVPQARADSIADWFFTPDQQGRLAFQRNDFGAAAEHFADPLWRGYVLYRDGQYEAAIEVLDRVETAQAAFIQGMAHIKSRGYRDGVRAFQTALTRDPDYPGAAENLAVAKEIVEYVERAREQSDTGEEAGIGADDVVFDNEANRGAETEMEAADDAAPTMLTTEQWMTTVDTRTGDFLRSRFLLEAANSGQSAEPGTADGSDAEPEETAE